MNTTDKKKSFTLTTTKPEMITINVKSCNGMVKSVTVPKRKYIKMKLDGKPKTDPKTE